MRQQARHLHGLFDGASELAARVVPEVCLTRLNQLYGPALHVARLVLERRSLDIGVGSTPGQAFLVNMHIERLHSDVQVLAHRFAGPA